MQLRGVTLIPGKKTSLRMVLPIKKKKKTTWGGQFGGEARVPGATNPGEVRLLQSGDGIVDQWIRSGISVRVEYEPLRRNEGRKWRGKSYNLDKVPNSPPRVFFPKKKTRKQLALNQKRPIVSEWGDPSERKQGQVLGRTPRPWH